MEYVVLVDEMDNAIGEMEKLQAHVEGRLHRAISVFVFNSRNELLLQQRADGKYHSALLWTNTCCSHPRPGEPVADAAHRRLYEEMGLKCALQESFSFTYKANVENGLTEHEYDHVFTGVTDGAPHPDKDEVVAWRYISLHDLQNEIQSTPENFTSWFKICIENRHKDLFSRAK